jgi:hypothetical protein
MSNEQLEIAMTLCKRQLALWDRGDAERRREIEPAEMDEPVSD